LTDASIWCCFVHEKEKASRRRALTVTDFPVLFEMQEQITSSQEQGKHTLRFFPMSRLKSACSSFCKVLFQFFAKRCHEDRGGFTLIELAIVMTIVGTLAAIAIPISSNYIEKARVAKAIAEIRILQGEIDAYEVVEESLPNTLADIGRANLLDPWDNPYQYLNFDTVAGLGPLRKDRFLVPLNSDYDLYSMGKDGSSQPPLTAQVSYDDIIRANDGRYIGKASEY
jgi:general secretion pathway protein G